MNIKPTVLVLSLLLLSASSSCAEESQAPAAEPTEAEVVVADTTEPTEGPVVVGNKICPVSGGEIGAMGEGVDVEHNGKIYKLCCAMCVKDFNKDPEKYVKMVEEMMAKEAAEEAAEGGMHEGEGMMHEHQHE